MTGSILKRLVWKEYRLLRGFWWAMFAAALLGQLYAMWLFSRTPHHAPSIFLIGFALTACYALGCGATAFAGERESGTYTLQRVLPVTPPHILLGKVFFAATSTFALGVLLWFVAALMVRLWWQTEIEASAEFAMLGALKSMELLAWGMFYSLLMARPLRAAVLAALTTVVISYPLSWLLSDIPDHARTVFYFPSFLGDRVTIIPRVVVLALVAGCDIYLVNRWFRDSDGDSVAAGRRNMAVKSRARRLVERWIRWPSQQRLYWQLGVRSRWMLFTAVLSYLILLPLVAAIWPMWSLLDLQNTLGLYQVYRESADFSLLFLATLVPVAGLVGVFAFADDQRHYGFRFFAEHGIAARQIWWTRQFFWNAVLAAGLLTVALIQLIAANRSLDTGAFWADFGRMFLLVVTAYAAGQLCSLWFRSSILAGAITISLATTFALWFYLMTVAGVNVWGAVFPIPCALYVATWWTVSDWLKEHSGGMVRVRRAILLLAPISFVVMFAIIFRWLEIPAVTPQFDAVPHTRTQIEEGRETARLYVQLYDRYLPPNDHARDWSTLRAVKRDQHGARTPRELFVVPTPKITSSWLASQQDLLHELVEVSGREHFTWQDPDPSVEPWFPTTTIQPLQQMMILSARQHEEAGELSEALEQYLAALRMGRHIAEGQLQRGWGAHGYAFESIILHHMRYWASAPGQTSQLIRQAIDLLQQEWSRPLPYEEFIEKEHTRGIAGFEEFLAGQGPSASLPERVSRHLPWECARMKRLLDVGAAYQLESIRSWHANRDEGVAADLDPSRIQQLGSWIRTSPEFLRWYFDFCFAHVDSLVQNESVRRGTLLVLALEGWRLEQGELPESLDQLVPGWFEALPLDPVTAQPFSYYPQGEDAPLEMLNYAGVWENYGSSRFKKLSLPSHTAYLTAPIPGRDHPLAIIVFPVPNAPLP